LFTTNPDDYDLRFTLGGLEKRVGNLVEAKAVYEELLPMRPADPLLRNNLGNVVFELDRPGEALVYYRRAVELDPTLAAPHFNASQALLRELEFHRAREEFNLAHALDPQLVLAASAEGDEAAIRRLIDLDLPSTHLWQRLFRERILLADPGELSRKITGLSLVINLPWSLVLSVFLGALFILHRKSISGLSCSACGKPFCPRCRPTTVLELCPACDRRIEKTAVPELQKRILAQIREVSRRQRRVPLLLLTVALPGTAHLQRSAPFRGFFFLGGTAALFLAWRMRGAVVEAPGSLGTLLSEPTQIIALGIATLAFYGIACLSILRIYHGKS
jgi:tetratricopeptide (TPR) repeat protein